MNDPTESQEYCLLVIENYIRENGYSPTRLELKEILKQKSTNGVNQKLTALKKKGFIALDPPMKKRNIKILRRSQKQFDLFNNINNTEKSK